MVSVTVVVAARLRSLGVVLARGRRHGIDFVIQFVA
jgi:hypothetical protein